MIQRITTQEEYEKVKQQVENLINEATQKGEPEPDLEMNIPAR